jgi:hypothetical protein
VLVARADEVLFSKGYGSANLEWKIPGANTAPLLAESEAVFYFEGTNLRIEFLRDASGAVTEMLLQQGTRQDRARRR